MKLLIAVTLKIWQIEKFLRRVFYSFDTPLRRRLDDRKRRVAQKAELTTAEQRELDKLNVLLGNFPRRFNLSKEEIAARKKFADRFISRMAAEKKAL